MLKYLFIHYRKIVPFMLEEQVILSGVLSVSILVFLAKMMSSVFGRFNIPSVLGELTAGIVFGPYALGQFITFFGTPLININEIVSAFAQIGAILILFSAGLETSFSEFRGESVRSFIVGGLGVVLPFFMGYYFASLLGFTFPAALLTGAALSATSIAVTSRVLESLGVSKALASRLVINAAVVDDVLGLAVLGIVISIIQQGTIPTFSEIFVKLITIIVLWVGLLLGLVFFVPKFMNAIPRWRAEGTEEAASTVVCFGAASLATILGLSPIVGAYAAGMGLATSRTLTGIRSYLDKINMIFAPIFFAVIGASLNISQLSLMSLLFLPILFAIAAISKLAGCGLPAWLLLRSGKKGLQVGIAMVSRGEVGLVIAGLGLSEGVISQDVYSALVGMVILTTLFTPFLMKKVFKNAGSE